MKTTHRTASIPLAVLALITAQVVHADPLHVTDLLSGQIRITELMADPAKVSDTKGEWFEIYNTLDRPVDLQGLLVASKGTGTTIESFRVHSSALIDGGGLFLFGRTPASSENGGLQVDWAWGNAISLGNTRDFLALEAPDGATLAKVSWTTSTGGTSWEVHGGSAIDEVQANLVAAPGAFTYGRGDVGTPGAFNSDMLAYESSKVAAAVPEPSTVALLGIGLACGGMRVLRRRHAH